MATQFKKSKLQLKSKSKSKSKIQSKQQTLNILQNVFECSIAGICRDRKLFPAHYFVNYETNDDNLMVCKFDLDLLLDPLGGGKGEGDTTSSTGSTGSCNGSSRTEAGRSSITTTSSSSRGSNLSENHTARTTRCQSIENSRDSCSRNCPFLPSISPLTSSMLPMTMTMSSTSTILSTTESDFNDDVGDSHYKEIWATATATATEVGYTAKYSNNDSGSGSSSSRSSSSSSSVSRHSCSNSRTHEPNCSDHANNSNATSSSTQHNDGKNESTSNEYDNDRHFKIEALLLLTWIRNGVMEMMKRDQLAKLFFAICVPSNNSENENENMNHEVIDDNTHNNGNNNGKFNDNDNGNERKDKLDHRRSRKQDKIVESYVFDMSQFNEYLSNCNNMQNSNEGDEGDVDGNSNDNDNDNGKDNDDGKKGINKSSNSRRCRSKSNTTNINDEGIDHEQMQIQYDTLFRNLQSFSRTTLPPIHYSDDGDDNVDGSTHTHTHYRHQRKKSFSTSNTSSLSTLHSMTSAPVANANTNTTNASSISPKSRYFNVRIEFKNKQRQEQQFLVVPRSSDFCSTSAFTNTNTNTSTNMKSPGTTITENDVKNNKEQVIEIPRAIDPMNDINALFAVDNCSNKLHIRKGNSTMNEYDNVIPSTVKSTRGLLDMPLGKVVEEKVTGLGVKVVAYHCCDEGEGNDDEVDDSTKDTDDIHDMEEEREGGVFRQRKEEAKNDSILNQREGERSQDGFTSIDDSNKEDDIVGHDSNTHDDNYKVNPVSSQSKKRSVISCEHDHEYGNTDTGHRKKKQRLHHCVETLTPCESIGNVQYNCPILVKHSNVFALPHNRTDNKTLYLQCKVLGHRFRKNSILDYKVLFSDQKLEEAKMKKQWITAEKVISYDVMQENICNVLERDLLTSLGSFCDSPPTSKLENIAEELRLPLQTVQSVLSDCRRSADIVRKKRPSSCRVQVNNNTTISETQVLGISRSHNINDDENLMIQRRNVLLSKFCYAIEPIQVLV